MKTNWFYGIWILFVVVRCAVPNQECQRTIEWVDFIRFDEIEYLRVYENSEALTAEMIGEPFGTIQFHAAERCDAMPPWDNAAAYLPEGMVVYTLQGYQPTFRLVVVQSEEILLYEAFTNPHAQ